MRFAHLLLVVVPAFAGVKEAVAYLEAEVPSWKPQNGCYSCHNNGDGARAVLVASGAQNPAVADTLRFLRDPGKWPKDLAPLALVQFANALFASGESGAPFRQAVEQFASKQKADGHFEMDAEAAAGSPVTYGPVLGTVIARDLLMRGDGAKAYAKRIQDATAWLAARRGVEHPMDIAALILALNRKPDIDKLIAMQGKDGSWNGSEAFDTAVAMIALKSHAPDAVKRGRDFLLRNQLGPGGWRGTTRPAGGQSYAQHISTTAWALMALVATSKD
jgi:hypothetical protein